MKDWGAAVPGELRINRAPVLTLWTVVVAERLGFKREEALSLGKAVAGLNAQTKGRRLGIFKSMPEEARGHTRRAETEKSFVGLMGRQIPVVRTRAGLRAAIRDEQIEPKTVQTYLETKFGNDLPDVRGAMEELAQSLAPEILTERAFELYETFRPEISAGKKGWGAAGVLRLDTIRALARRRA